jgi:uncharacterized membrane protein YfhO
MPSPTSPAPASDPPDPQRSRRGHWIGALACAGAIVLCEILVFRYLFQYGLSNFGAVDGASQHFPALMYIREWFTAILSGHGGNYGLWSWRLGLGGDTLTSISYYIGDPFALVTLLFPVRLMEYVYEALFFIRVICAGLAGYYYMRTMKATKYGAVAGALVFVFSGFLLQLATRQPFYVNAMILFPLILAGVDKVLAGRRWYLLVGMLLLTGVDNFYWFYQLGIVAVVYAVVRWVELTPRGERLRRIVRDGLRVAGWYILGGVLAAFILVPLVIAVLTSSRVATNFGLPLFYPIRAYLSDFVSLISVRTGTSSFYGGFAVVGFLALGVLLLRRGNLGLKAMLGVFAVFAIFPVFGRMLNGFSFPSYRGLFMAGLFLGTAVALVLSDRRPLSRRELAWTGGGLAIFSVLEVLACRFLGSRLLLVLAPLGVGALAWAAFATEWWLSQSAAKRGEANAPHTLKTASVLRASVIVLIVVGITAAGVGSFDRRYNPALNDYWKLGTVYDRYAQDAGSSVASLPLDGLQRVDKQTGVLNTDLQPLQSNDPLAEGFAGLDYYYSVMGDGTHEYAKAMADRAKRLPFDIEGFDDRAVLDTLAGVRYYLAPASGAQYVPYGFAPVSKIGTDTVYENRYTLPVGYVYHSVISPNSFTAMSPLDRQQSLLQGVVVDDGQAPTVPRIQVPSEAIEVTYTLTSGAGLSWDTTSHVITMPKGSVKEGTAYADLTFAPVPDAELYLELKGSSFTNPKELTVAAEAAGPKKYHRIMPPSRGYYWGDDTLLINLGYNANGTTKARFSFGVRDTVHYASLRILAVPMAKYAERVQALGAEGMTGVKVGADTLSGSVTSHGDGVLFLSIPYSTGWSATVDGAPARIVKANLGFSGIAVTSGTHVVALKYATPGLLIGSLLSLVALLVAIALAILTERRLAARRRAQQTTAGAEGD